MKSGFHMLGASALAVSSLIAGAALAQPPAAAPAAAPNPLVSTNPNYVTINMRTTVNKPAAEVWARVGKYCDIGEWLLRNPAGCTLRSGTGEIGTHRSVGEEIMVGKTPLSYTYSQTVGFQARGAGANRPYNHYHGHLEARPLTPTTSELIYVLVYDNSMVPGDAAAKEAEMANRRRTFEGALANMKILAEGGTLPPPPARGGAAPAAPAPAGRGG